MTKILSMREKIDLIPGDDGWWHTSNGETFHRLAVQLVRDGRFTEDEAVDLLTAAYFAVRDEFGG